MFEWLINGGNVPLTDFTEKAPFLDYQPGATKINGNKMAVMSEIGGLYQLQIIGGGYKVLNKTPGGPYGDLTYYKDMYYYFRYNGSGGVRRYTSDGIESYSFTHPTSYIRSVVADDVLYMAGYNNLFSFDGTTVTQLTTSRRFGYAPAIGHFNGKIIISTGDYTYSYDVNKKEIVTLDTVGSKPPNIGWSTHFTIGNYLYLVNGYNRYGPLQTSRWRLNLLTYAWESVDHMFKGVTYGATAVMLDDYLVFIGGFYPKSSGDQFKIFPLIDIVG